MLEAVRRKKLDIAPNALKGGGMGGKVRVYWDNSNIYNCAANTVKEREKAPRAGERIRVNFEALKRLALAGREGLVIRGRKGMNIPRRKEPVVIAASKPPTEGALWNAMASSKDVRLLNQYNRGGGREQQVPDLQLRLEMTADVLDSDAPGVAVLLTGDGGFLPWLQRMHAEGWGAEVLAWESGHNRGLKEWAEKNGVFISLDDYCDAVTYVAKAPWRRGPKIRRRSAELTRRDLLARPKASPAR